MLRFSATGKGGSIQQPPGHQLNRTQPGSRDADAVQPVI
jgi:hypothetical protein